MEAGKNPPPGVTATNLLETSPASWAESDLTLKEPIEENPGKDRRGPVSLGVTVTIRAPEPSPAPSPSPSPSPSALPSAEAEEPKKKPEGRVVAIGDSDFASNALLGFQGNRDFFLNSVAWLSEDSDLISIRPKEKDDQRLFLTRNQHLGAVLLALGGIPGLFVVLGISAWWRRR
jgi:ABC-type uncharacterized transport system involved in gliding motility auxiliary subunit